MTACPQCVPVVAPRRWPLRLAVFDLDGTLKEASSPWMYLHHALGTDVQAEAYRQQFERGEINYTEWARLDSALWKGVALSHVQALFRRNVYRPGVRELFAFLHRQRAACAIVSTGLTVHAEQVAAELGVWRTVANELQVEDGMLTGTAIVNVMEHTKGEIMAALRQELAVSTRECLAVGDGTADIDLFAQAGLAVAVCPRSDVVRRAAHYVIDDGDLRAVIPLIRQHFAAAPTPVTSQPE